MSMKRSLGKEVGKQARRSVRVGMSGLLAAEKKTIGEITESPAEFDRTESTTTPAVGAVRALGRSPLVAGTLQLVRSDGTGYGRGVDFEELPASGSYRNLAMPVGVGLTARYQYRQTKNQTVDHGATVGLADDDHPQYALADGTRLRLAEATTIPSPAEGQLASSSGTLVVRRGTAWTPLQATPLTHPHDPATALQSGFMSAADKSVLESLAAQVARLAEGGGGGGAQPGTPLPRTTATRLKLGG